MAPALKQRQQTTAAEKVVARLDSYSQEEHTAALEAARERIAAKKARRERAAAAAARLRAS